METIFSTIFKTEEQHKNIFKDMFKDLQIEWNTKEKILEYIYEETPDFFFDEEEILDDMDLLESLDYDTLIKIMCVEYLTNPAYGLEIL